MSRDQQKAPLGYSATLTAEVVGITYRQLDHWARTGLIAPSLADAAGSGSRRVYSYTNLLELKVIKRLLDAGIKLNKIRTIFDYMRQELQEDISRANLVIDGDRVLCPRGDTELIDVLVRGRGVRGQRVLNVLPLSTLEQEVDAAIVELRPADDAVESVDDGDEFHEADLWTASGLR
ncbi:MAG: MerR family transcriptional regulator [Acidimicrobiaceae bacterium]|nr:MerR family transcriptional regulator [Acidimicrobiaceae bacterium]MCY4295168.1 MerR family transcriptional regulator [Acidimicrobiaceae bacterium]